MNGRAPVLLDHLAALADATRSRLLLLLDRHELTVSELCAILQLPQSTVSRHLKALADSGWLDARAEGTSRVYSMARDDLDAPARRLWRLVREQVAATSAATEDQRRLQRVLADRRSATEAYFTSSAGTWDRVRTELFGDRFHLAALAGLADRHWVVGDLGCGTGEVIATIAPFVGHVIGVDQSAAMLQAARRRLHGVGNVDLRRGELEALPIDDGRLHVALMMLVLHHAPDPRAAVGEMARVLAPGGRALIVDMFPHDRDSYRQMGHVWLGFAGDHLQRLLEAVGFVDPRIVALPPDARAKGPALFVCSATKAGSSM
jgi:ArsR family transcriptional regulator